MKIIQLVYALGAGGAERVVVDLANEMSKRGHDVIVCAILDLSIFERFSFNIKNLSNKVRYENLHQQKGFSIQKMKVIEHFINDESPDIVHCHLNNIPYIFRIALKDKKIKFVYTLHSLAEKASGSKLQSYINRFFFKREIITPVTISKECSLSYRRYYKLNNDTCIPNGRASIHKTNRFEEVQYWGMSLKEGKKEIKTFIHIARYNPQKNQRMLIKAFNALANSGYEFLLIVIGPGWDSSETDALRNSACSKIHFLGPTDNVVDYLYISDAFCLTSITEGLPISLIEAMSCGCIPICTPVGGCKDIITDNETGYLSNDISAESYLLALERFMNKNSVSKEKVIEYYKNNFSIESVASKYLETYERICEKV